MAVVTVDHSGRPLWFSGLRFCVSNWANSGSNSGSELICSSQWYSRTGVSHALCSCNKNIYCNITNICSGCSVSIPHCLASLWR